MLGVTVLILERHVKRNARAEKDGHAILRDRPTIDQDALKTIASHAAHCLVQFPDTEPSRCAFRCHSANSAARRARSKVFLTR